jgi:acyl-CoA synthetase (AMP-forming)/AMP-acid ligase II
VNTNLAQLIVQSSKDVPDQVALILLEGEEEEPITFRELVHGALRFAGAYENAGIRQGEVVVLILQHGRDLIESFLGAILYGSIPAIMPFLTEKLAPERYRESIQALISISEPAAIVTYPEFMQDVQAAVKQGSPVRAILLNTDLPDSVTLDPEACPGLFRSSDDLVLLQHSSGTTGLQKGVALSNQAVLNQLENYRASIKMSTDDVVVSWLPLYHDMGLIAGFIMPILLRSKLVLMSPFEWVRAPYRLHKAVSKYQGTLSWLPNFAFNFCSQKIRDRDLEGVDLSSWRAVVNCSEPMRYDSHELFYERFKEYGLAKQALVTCYAMAENVFAVTQGGIESSVAVDSIDRKQLAAHGEAVPLPGGSNSMKLLSAGTPIRNTRVKIIDDHGHQVADRIVGEIAIRGDCLLSGYYHRADVTEKSFLDGWYLTGDLGYLAAGELYVTGRRKEIIIVGGKNVYPQDLEYLAAEIPGVHPGRVVVFGLFNEQLGTEEIILVAEVDVNGDEERIKLAREIQSRITQGTDVTVRYVETVDPGWLIKTSSGKIARGANREKYLKDFRGTA